MILGAPTLMTGYEIQNSTTPTQLPSVTVDAIITAERKRKETFLLVLESSTEPSLSSLVKTLWEKVCGNCPGVLMVPFLNLRDNGVLLTWDNGPHHLDIEISLGVPFDFFYMNRKTEEAWDIEVAVGERIPDQVLRAFNFFRVVG
jgi:hypothetical protein